MKGQGIFSRTDEKHQSTDSTILTNPKQNVKMSKSTPKLIINKLQKPNANFSAFTAGREKEGLLSKEWRFANDS